MYGDLTLKVKALTNLMKTGYYFEIISFYCVLSTFKISWHAYFSKKQGSVKSRQVITLHPCFYKNAQLFVFPEFAELLFNGLIVSAHSFTDNYLWPISFSQA